MSVHIDFLLVDLVIFIPRGGERKERREVGWKKEEVREGREEGGSPPCCFCAWVAHCTCRLTASRFDRSLPSERRRGGRRRSGRRFSVKKRKRGVT